MATGAFDRLNFLAWPVITDTSTISTEIQDPNGLPSEKVIRMSDAWQVQFDWKISGVLALLPLGSFEVEVDAEYLGQEIVCGKTTVPAADGVFSANSTLDFTNVIVPVAAGVIKQEGVYRVTKHLRYTSPNPAFKTAAFVESEDIEFY